MRSDPVRSDPVRSDGGGGADARLGYHRVLWQWRCGDHVCGVILFFFVVAVSMAAMMMPVVVALTITFALVGTMSSSLGVSLSVVGGR